MILANQFSRRNVLQGAAVAAAVTTLGSTPAQANDRLIVKVRGKVWVDRKSGLAGALVTNGRQVAVTDHDGRYELDLSGEGVISLIKPSGYAVPVDPATRLPKFHYIHRPNGTPADLNLAHPGIAPTGPLPASVDFHVETVSEPTKFDVLLFADPQPETDAEVDFIRDGLIPAVAGTKAAFGITMGDIVGDDLSLFGRINALIGTLGVPWYNVCGNHDLNYESRDNTYARETFIRTFGPSHFAFGYGGAMFIMLDNVVYEGADASQPGQMGSYHDEISQTQLDFVANVLAHTPPETLLVLGMHIPLKSKLANGRDIAADDTARLLSLLGDRPAISFAGHTHMAEHRYIWAENASAPHHHHVLTTVCGSWWSGPYDRRGVAIADACDGSPNGYYVLSVDGAQYDTTFHAVHETSGRQMRAMLSEKLSDEYRGRITPKLRRSTLRADELARTELVVNVFDGGPKTRAAFSIDCGPETAMWKESRTDPFVAAVYANNKATIKPWVKAENSSHVWAAPLPDLLPPGVHNIVVTATDEFGRSHRETLAFEIEGADKLLAVRG